MQRLLLLGLNHNTAPLEVRERLAFNAIDRDAAIAALREKFPGCEAVLLSTCNRVEIYIARGIAAESPTLPGVGEMVEFLAEHRSVPAPHFREHLYHKTGTEVVEHLFTVASSLDSMVLGETQILGQVRDAYDAARATRAAGPLLHPLFQRAISVGKQVLHETRLAEGQVSIASVAVDCARQIFESFGGKTVLCIGAGKMTTLVMRRFAGLRPGRLLVCNRDHSKASKLAGMFAGESVSFDRLSEWVTAADVVISSTGATEPILSRAAFEPIRRQRRGRPIFFIDIAVPRDIDPAISQLENVYLYNLDDLQQVVSANMGQRKQGLEMARAIIREQVDAFSVWHRQREVGPTIDRLYKRYHRLAREELERTLGRLSSLTPADRANLEDMTRRIVNKLLHRPVEALRGADGLAPGSSHLAYAHAMEKLFDLESPEPPAGVEAVTEAAVPLPPNPGLTRDP